MKIDPERNPIAYALRRCAAVISSDIGGPNGQPLLAARDEPLAPDDSGWQFTCGKDCYETSDARIWLLEEVVHYDPSVLELLESPPGAHFARTDSTEPWVRES